ncbi:ABC transporter permease subunit [Asanoa sp. NPDC050611]|uniref:ABC transporter permease subunit n=1 Tax=Asanoa sp. NPDC050611 TaxID=3157098 RepID=UPI0033D821E0
MSLPKAEVRRLFKRRVTRIFLAITLVGLAIFPVVFMINSKTSSPDVRAAAELQANLEFERATAQYQQMRTECEAAKARGETGLDERYGPNCGADFPPQAEWFPAEAYLPYEFNFRDEFPASLEVLAAILAMVAFVVGASFVGAEWNSGGMMNLLLWRPRRVPVLLTKLGVLVGSMLGVTAVVTALWTVAFWAIGRFDGRLGELTSGVWQSFGLTGLRGVTLVLLAATIGFCLASIGRHTAMALGVGIGAIVVSEIGLRIVFELIRVQFGDRYILSTYLVAWFEKSMTIVDYRACDFISNGPCTPPEYVVTWQQSGVLLATVLVLGVFGAVWSMRRRDVT